jgi:hypothetical protein
LVALIPNALLILLPQWVFSQHGSMRLSPMIAVLLLCLAPASWSQQLSCRPCNYGFGKVKVGTPASFSIRLTNTGTKAVRIGSKSKTGSEFHFGSFPLPVTLMPGKSVLLPIIFKPTAIGHVTGTFNLVSNAIDRTLSLPVAGTGAPVLTVSTTSLNFGKVTVGKSASLPVTLTASDGDVTLISDQFTSSEFSLSGISVPTKIFSGQSVRVNLKFMPGQSGTASGKVGYFSNAVASPAVVQLTGTGAALSAHNVSLTWQDSGAQIVGYNIYRGANHGGPYQVINNVLDASANYVDYNVSAGATYYYVTTASDGAGHESGYSNESKAVIPTP